MSMRFIEERHIITDFYYLTLGSISTIVVHVKFLRSSVVSDCAQCGNKTEFLLHSRCLFDFKVVIDEWFERQYIN